MIPDSFADHFESLWLAVLFAAIFAGAGRVPLPPILARRERGLVSFFAGLSLAYVFVHLLPELETAKASLKLPRYLRLPPEPYLVSLAALVGCLLFFALGRLDADDRARPSALGARIRLAVFAFYVAVVSYSRIVWLSMTGSLPCCSQSRWERTSLRSIMPSAAISAPGIGNGAGLRWRAPPFSD